MVFKSKKVAKLNSTEMDFWRRSAKSPGRTKLGILLLKKINVARSLLDDIKTKQLQ